MLRAILRRFLAFLRRSRSKPVLVVGMDRRTFLRLTAAAGAIALLPGPVPGKDDEILTGIEGTFSTEGYPFSLTDLKDTIKELQNSLAGEQSVILTSEAGFRALKRAAADQARFQPAEPPIGFQSFSFNGIPVHVTKSMPEDVVYVEARLYGSSFLNTVARTLGV
jgi:hypothetical protein